MAGKLGPSHVVFWLLALVLFYLPSAAVVIYLNRLMPLEGGLYQWAKLGFNQTVGFMLAWNLWLYVIVFTSEIGLQCATYLSYAHRAGRGVDDDEHAGSWRWRRRCILSLMVVASTIGLSVGKWVHNTGGVFMITIFGALMLLPFIGLATGHLARVPSVPHRACPSSRSTTSTSSARWASARSAASSTWPSSPARRRAPARSVRRSVLHRGAGHRADVRARHEHGGGLRPDQTTST